MTRSSKIIFGLCLILSAAKVSGGFMTDFISRQNQPYELIDLALQAVSPQTDQEDWKPINSTRTVRDSTNRTSGTKDFIQSPSGGTAGSPAGSIKSQVEHLKVIELKVRVNNVDYILELQINKFLLSSEYQEKLLHGGKTQILMSDSTDIIASHCYYTGSVKGYNGSIAAVSTCNGIVGFFEVEGKTYYIEPSGSVACLSCPHRVYFANPEHQRSSDTYQCGVADDISDEDHLVSRLRRAMIDQWPQDLDGKTRLVELYVVNDHYQYLNKSSNPTTVAARAKNIINIASSIFQQEDIYLIIVGLETWADTHRITATTDANQYLNDFKNYVTTSVIQAHDCACLITGFGPFAFGTSTSVVGLASTGAMCSASSQFFTADLYPAAAVAGTITAHECGHVFGLQHTNQPDTCPCNASDPNALCVMNAVTNVQTPATQWAPCSKDKLHSADSYTKYTCLNNRPNNVFDNASFCGNGLVEAGEDCDCGWAPTAECNPKCCSNATCKLINNAQCAFGKCCDVPQCKFTPRYTECRAATGTCDLSEYCSGSTAFCPSDIYKADFSTCTTNNSESSYCFKNRCESRSTRCNVVYGSTAVVAEDICYMSANADGDEHGNCGFLVPGNYTVFKKCSSVNAFCGQLQCAGSGLAIQSGQGFVTAGYRGYWGGASNWVYCYSAVYQPDPVYGSLGHVPNGTPCGTGKACKDQVCSDLTVLTSGKSCTTCSGNGVCNALDQCHCNKGFGSADCSQIGEGGSPHSNGIAPSASTAAVPGTTSQTSTTIKPTTSTITSTTSADKPTTGAIKPTTSADKPTTGAIKPTTSADKPTTNAIKPTTSADKPTTSAIKPTTSADKPTTSTIKPMTSADKPGTGIIKQTTSAGKPITGVPQETSSTSKPTSTTRQATITPKVITAGLVNATTQSTPKLFDTTPKALDITTQSITKLGNITSQSTPKSVNATTQSTTYKATTSSGSPLTGSTINQSSTKKPSDSNNYVIIIVIIIGVVCGFAFITVILCVCGRTPPMLRPVNRLPHIHEYRHQPSLGVSQKGPTLRFVPAYRAGY